MSQDKSSRKIVVSLRLTRAEHSAAKLAAKKLGMSLNEYYAATGAGAAHLLEVPPEKRPERPAALADLLYFADVQRKGAAVADASRR